MMLGCPLTSCFIQAFGNCTLRLGVCTGAWEETESWRMVGKVRMLVGTWGHECLIQIVLLDPAFSS